MFNKLLNLFEKNEKCLDQVKLVFTNSVIVAVGSVINGIFV